MCRVMNFRLNGTLRLSQARHTFGDELLLPPTGFDVSCLLPEPHLSTDSQNTEQTRPHHCESHSDVFRSQVLPRSEYTHRSPPSLAISSATCSASRIRVGLVVDTDRRRYPYDSTIECPCQTKGVATRCPRRVASLLPRPSGACTSVWFRLDAIYRAQFQAQVAHLDQ